MIGDGFKMKRLTMPAPSQTSSRLPDAAGGYQAPVADRAGNTQSGRGK